MNDFLESLKVNPKDLSRSGKQVAIMRLQNILLEQMKYVEENDSFSMYEKLEQMTIFYRMEKILENYDELEPVMQEFFNKKKWEGKDEIR